MLSCLQAASLLVFAYVAEMDVISMTTTEIHLQGTNGAIWRWEQVVDQPGMWCLDQTGDGA